MIKIMIIMLGEDYDHDYNHEYDLELASSGVQSCGREDLLSVCKGISSHTFSQSRSGTRKSLVVAFLGGLTSTEDIAGGDPLREREEEEEEERRRKKKEEERRKRRKEKETGKK